MKYKTFGKAVKASSYLVKFTKIRPHKGIFIVTMKVLSEIRNKKGVSK